jgi:hypothetical protein
LTVSANQDRPVTIETAPGRRITFTVDQTRFDAALNALLGGVEQLAKGRHVRPRSRIWRDPELARAVEQRVAERLTIDQIADFLEARFGRDRAPSRSSIGRYVRGLKLGNVPPTD